MLATPSDIQPISSLGMGTDPERTEDDGAPDTAGNSSPVKGSLKAAGRGVLWPARRFVDPRIQGVLGHVDLKHEELLERLQAVHDLQEARADSEVEAATVIGRSLNDILRETERITLLLEQPPGKRVIRDVAELDTDAANFLNYALGSEGFAAQAGLWFNPPVLALHRDGAVELEHVNERVAEVPYVFRALGALDAGARILDVGAAESTVALSLAALGYEVTALDPRGYPFSHPRLQAVQTRVEYWSTSEQFDAVVCLSTIEHVGLAAYEQEEQADADMVAIRRIHELTKPGGLLLLTVPFGASFHVDDFQRTYDRQHLDELLAGWEVDDLTILRRTSSATWQVEGPEARGDEPHVALVTARRSG